jgi:hypothetical protein
MSTSTTWTLPLLATLALGCRPPDPAPTELDELVHFFFAQAQEQDHERIIEGGDNLLAWYEAGGFDGSDPFSGTVTDLVQAEVDVLEEMEWSPDPELAAGVYAISELSCDLAAAAAISLEPNQLEVFVDNYKAYDRSWDTDPDCYLDGSCDGVDWTSEIEDNFVGNMGNMSYRVVVKLRRSRDEAGQPAAILIRSVMPTEATDDVDWGGFEQSYHIETYLPHDGGLLHLYGMWSYGWAFDWDADHDFWPTQYAQGLEDFEQQLQTLCVEGW